MEGMQVRVRLTRSLVVVAWLLAASGAQAEDGKAAGKDLIQKGQAKASQGAAGEAAALFGEAIAIAQKDGDLEGEQAAADPFLLLLKAQAPKGDVSELVATAAAKLDPKRLGAFVSAPCLAGEILVAVAGGGDPTHLGLANVILENHVDSPKAGHGLQSIARLGRGMALARGDNPSKAAATLREAQATFASAEWTDLVMVAGIERAALHVKAAQLEDAKQAIIDVCAHFDATVSRDSILNPGYLNPHHLQWWKAAVSVRLKDCPDRVLAPWAAWQGYARGGPAPRSDKGRSVAYEGAGPGRRTALAMFLAKATAGATVAKVKNEGFRSYSVMWDPKVPWAISNVEGQILRNYGGLGVAFTKWSFAVARVDFRVTMDQPTDQATVDVGRAWYRLARDETWAMAKDGTVSITK